MRTAVPARAHGRADRPDGRRRAAAKIRTGSPDELTSQQLYLLFLAWSAQEELDACHDEAGGVYDFDAAVICRTLDRYLDGYRFAASGGQLLAVARFPYALPGAKDALKGCDLTDLDGDGTSDLTAEFSFADGSTASLLWFYSDGGLVYNAEFSLLPGNVPAGDAE